MKKTSAIIFGFVISASHDSGVLSTLMNHDAQA